jgi:hypothetical protein
LVNYEASNFARVAVTVGNDFASLRYGIESVRTFAGETVTLSFYAKGTNPAATGNLLVDLRQVFGSGGSASVVLPEQSFVLTDNWKRYSFTFLVDSVSGKTITTNDQLQLTIGQGTSTSTDAWTLDIWGVQLEAGAVATPFRRNAPSIQAELAACQRYFVRYTATAADTRLGQGMQVSTTGASIVLPLQTHLRTNPISVGFFNLNYTDGSLFNAVISAVTIAFTSIPSVVSLNVTFPANGAQHRPGFISGVATGGFIEINAEL